MSRFKNPGSFEGLMYNFAPTYKRNTLALLTDFKKFSAFDKKSTDGSLYAEHFAQEILPKMDNLLDLNQLRATTLSAILAFCATSILQSIKSLSVFVEILTKIGSDSYGEWSRDQLWIMVQLLTQDEDPTNAATIFLNLAAVAHPLALKILNRAPEDIAPLIDSTHFLNLLDQKNCLALALQIVTLRPERMKALFTPITNFCSLIAVDLKKGGEFLKAVFANNDWSYRIACLIKSADDFMDIVEADRLTAYTLMEKHPQLILKLFKTIEAPKTTTISITQRNAYIKAIDALAEKRTAKTSTATLDGGQGVTLFSGSQPTPSASPVLIHHVSSVL